MQQKRKEKMQKLDGFALLCSAGVILCLLWDLLKILRLPGTDEINTYITMGQMVLAGLMIARGCLWRYRWWQCLALGLGWMLVSAGLQASVSVLGETAVPLQRGVLAFCVFCPLGCLLNEKQIRRFLCVFSSVWTACYAVLSCIGVYAALNDTLIYNFNRTLTIGISPSLRRFALFHYPTVTSSYLCIAILIALLGSVLVRRKWAKACFVLACVPMLICLSLTDGRGAFVSLGAAIGLGCSVHLYGTLLKKWNMKAALAVCCVVVACTTAVMYVAMPRVLDGFNGVKKHVQQTGGWITSAMAEETAEELEPTEEAETAPVEAVHRTQSSLGFLSGRQYVWKAAMELLRDHPRLLLTGTSPTQVMRYIQPYLADAPMQGYMHTHNLFLQVLVEGGVIALGLLIWFLVCFARAAFRLLLDTERSMWMRCLPIPAVAILIGELVDYITQLSTALQVTPLLMLFMGLTLVLGSKKYN